MKILLDTNILLDVATDRKPYSESSSLLLDWCEQRAGSAYIAWHSVSNLYYVLRAAGSERNARAFISELLCFVRVAETDNSSVVFALQLPLKDLEDSLQVAAAVLCRAQYLITRNKKHYRNAPIEPLQPEEFLSGRV
ncbi:PIN domain-containing protein [bacterium]|nr:PIN domain-containing protein [bacterium]MCI0601480.1 PIN domain-containing protein [bacterium]